MRISLTLKGDKGKEIIKCANDTLTAQIRIGSEERLHTHTLAVTCIGEAQGQENTTQGKKRSAYVVELKDHNGKVIASFSDVAR
jgi:hypothetical protein